MNPEPLPTAPVRDDGWFDPTPEKVIAELAAVRASCGEQSMEYATLLVRLGDAHMRQGRLSNPRAQECYEAALQICRIQGEETPETAWIYDQLANVKASSGDTLSAQGDLEKALSIWKDRAPTNAIASSVREDHVARRAEDLERLRRVNEFQNRQPPPIDESGGDGNAFA